MATNPNIKYYFPFTAIVGGTLTSTSGGIVVGFPSKLGPYSFTINFIIGETFGHVPKFSSLHISGIREWSLISAQIGTEVPLRESKPN
jgi:hypothetical protein